MVEGRVDDEVHDRVHDKVHDKAHDKVQDGLPCIEVIGDGFLLSLIPASYMVAFSLIGNQSLVWLDDDCIEILNTIILRERERELWVRIFR